MNRAGLVLEALPEEGDVPAFFRAAKPYLPPLAQRFSLLTLGEGGIRLRAPEGPITFDIDVRLAADNGSLAARVAGIAHLPVHLKALERTIDLPARGLSLEALTLRRSPRRVALALRPVPIERE